LSDVYATRADLFRYGLPRGLLANPGRLCASAAAGSDLFTLDGHGFENDTPLLFRAEAGGSLPEPIAPGLIYYAERVSESSFKARGSAGGPAIDLTTDGGSVVVSTALPIDEVLEFYSRFVDGFLPAHRVPLVAPYPITVTALVAELSAKKLLLIARQSSASMTEMEVSAKAQLTRWVAGIVLRDERATEHTNLAVTDATAMPDPRGWGTGGTLP
jgi:hypothetical protein